MTNQYEGLSGYKEYDRMNYLHTYVSTGTGMDMPRMVGANPPALNVKPVVPPPAGFKRLGGIHVDYANNMITLPMDQYIDALEGLKALNAELEKSLYQALEAKAQARAELLSLGMALTIAQQKISKLEAQIMKKDQDAMTAWFLTDGKPEKSRQLSHAIANHDHASSHMGLPLHDRH